MADSKNSANPKGRQLHQSELVAKLVPHPSQQVNLTVLSGFLGRSSRAEHWRLYFTLALDEYVEIPEESIVHNELSGETESVFSRTVLWVRSDTALRYTRTTSRRIRAESLRRATSYGGLNTDRQSRFAARSTRRWGDWGVLGIPMPLLSFDDVLTSEPDDDPGSE